MSRRCSPNLSRPLRHLLVLAGLLAAPGAAAQDSTATATDSIETADDEWDIEGNHGPSDTLRFETDEGTWMNLDVSPDGRWIAFDLLGDIYRVPISGGQAELLSGGVSWEHQPRFNPDGTRIAFTSDRGGSDNIWVMNADGDNREQVTELSETLPTNPTWLPDGDYIVVKRHVTNTRSLGGGEIWMYHVDGGSGIQLTEKSSFTSEQNEPYPSADGRWVYFSVSGPFDYNKNPHAGIFQIRRFDRHTGRNEAVTSGGGGAVRPTPSPDGRSLAFVRRIGLNTVLMIRDLETGAERVLFDGLDQDQQETWAVHGAYPGFQWTPDSENIVASFGGKLWSISLETGLPTAIPFRASVQQVVAQALRSERRLTDDSVSARMIRWPSMSPDGNQLAFQALGHIWTMEYPGGTPRRVTNLEAFEYSPSYSPDGRWITFVTWDDDDRGAVWKVRSSGGNQSPEQLTTNPNQYANPRFSPDGESIAFVHGSGVVNRNAGLGSETFLHVGYVDAGGGTIQHVTETANRGSNSRMPRVSWSADGTRLLFHENSEGNTVLTSVKLDGTDRRQLVTNENAEEIVVSPDGNWVAFKDMHNVYVAPLPRAGGDPVALGRGSDNVTVTKLSNYGGDWIDWRPDSRSLTWVLGPAFYHQTLAAAGYGTSGGEEDEEASDESDWVEANAAVDATITRIDLKVPRSTPTGTVVLSGARIVTMDGDLVIENGDVVVTENRIVEVRRHSENVPAGARVIDASGKTVIPGLVDVHAHMGYLALDINPERTWEYYANLAYGVTTTHDPSASTQLVFSQSEMVEAGLTVGPRIFSTGFILYGAVNDSRATVNNLEDAVGHLRRLKAVGAFSVKSYNQLSRNARQWIIQAARDEDMLVVPEGGSMWQQNMTQILDGHTGLEHAIPLAPLYRDALTLLSSSRTGYTPTLVVGYGGIWGENYWYQESDVYANERLQQFVPRTILDARARRRILIPDDEFYHFRLAETARDVVRAGGSVQLGAHGQLQGLGAHWELWMFAQGGMTPMEAIRSATLSGAQYLGLGADLGSVTTGKLADMVILNSNPLENIRNSEDISMVMKNGVLYDQDMNQIWPEAVPMPELRVR